MERRLQPYYGKFMTEAETGLEQRDTPREPPEPMGRRQKRKQEIRSRIEEAAYALFQQLDGRVHPYL